jgi:hypothetical protein
MKEVMPQRDKSYLMKMSLRGVSKAFGTTKQSQKARFFAPLRMTSEGLGMTV